MNQLYKKVKWAERGGDIGLANSGMTEQALK
jgi:hypothetical protein